MFGLHIDIHFNKYIATFDSITGLFSYPKGWLKHTPKKKMSLNKK